MEIIFDTSSHWGSSSHFDKLYVSKHTSTSTHIKPFPIPVWPRFPWYCMPVLRQPSPQRQWIILAFRYESRCLQSWPCFKADMIIGPLQSQLSSALLFVDIQTESGVVTRINWGTRMAVCAEVYIFSSWDNVVSRWRINARVAQTDSISLWPSQCSTEILCNNADWN